MAETGLETKRRDGKKPFATKDLIRFCFSAGAPNATCSYEEWKNAAKATAPGSAILGRFEEVSNGNQRQSGHRACIPESSRWPLRIDHREVKARLVQIAGDSGLFDVQLASLKAGDYVVNRRVVVERKTHLDFVLSILDGRLFAQAAALQLSGQRSLFLVEGPRPPRLPRVHPDAIKGALLSLAVSWRLPVVFSRDPEDSLKCLKMLAEQSQALSNRRLMRAGPRPNGGFRRRLFLLQGLPGVGPSLAQRLLAHFGSVEKILLADMNLLLQVDGCGPKTAATIRSIIADAVKPPHSNSENKPESERTAVAGSKLV